MKQKQHPNPRQERAAARSLYSAILTLETVDECRRFMEDLCTPAELEAMVDRWSVVPLLRKGVPYRQIHDRTGVSVTTIGRVARFLSEGNDGYNLAAERLEAN